MRPVRMRNLCLFSREMRQLFVLVLLVTVAGRANAEGQPSERNALPYNPGEELKYTISWSNIFSAGKATMSVLPEQGANGEQLIRFLSTARSIGMVDKFYRVDDKVQSLFDTRNMRPLAYQMRQRHGKRKKDRDLLFDHAKGTVVSRRDGIEEISEVPGDAQDALSSLYVLRSRGTFTNGGPVVINVHDSGKTWAVEIYVLGRERITVPAGTFETIKLKTYPKYEGVFMHRGEIFIWLTDDARRLPVLMKSTITIGSIMATLDEVQLGETMQ